VRYFIESGYKDNESVYNLVHCSNRLSYGKSLTLPVCCNHYEMKYTIPLFTLIVFSLISCSHKTAEQYYNLALNERNSEKKVDLLSKAIELNPNYFDAINHRAFMYEEITVSLHGTCTAGEDKEYYKKSLIDFESALKLQPNSGQTYCRRGVVEHYMGDTIQSCKDLNKALSLGFDCKDDIKEFCK